jgi:hypothetical protein
MKITAIHIIRSVPEKQTNFILHEEKRENEKYYA